MANKISLVLLSLFLLAAGFGAGFSYGEVSGAKGSTNSIFTGSNIFSGKPSFDLLNEGVEAIMEAYVDSGKVKEEDLIYGAMQGMVKSLGDPYSVFLKPEVSKTFQEDIGGSFEGIGAEIGMREEVLTIISPLKGSPAESAGLKAGDEVLFVDDNSTQDLALDEAVQMIRGKKGTEVVLTVIREGESESKKISIIRDTIKIPNISWEIKEGNVAYIQLYHFTETASEDFKNVANEVLKSDADRIVLDLRNNPGGLLEVSVDIAGWFFQEGMVVTTEDRGGKGVNSIYKTRGSGALEEYPMVVLTNQGSASASEILAGALRDHSDVKLVGEQTFGKGSVQQLIKLSDGSNIKITVAKWLTPKGYSIEGNGLDPDVKVEMTQEIFEKEGDVQLEKAIEVVKGL